MAAGSDVLVFTTSTHFDSRHFAAPHLFDVERFAAPREEHRQKYVFAPYGGGPHICLGAGMGEAQLLFASAMLLRHGGLNMPDPTRKHRHVYDPALAIDPGFVLRR